MEARTGGTVLLLREILHDPESLERHRGRGAALSPEAKKQARPEASTETP